MLEEESPYHHGSHRSLLLPPEDSCTAGRGVDAIFVPTVRRPAYLAEAANLAEVLGCVLVTLHSGKWTNAAKAVRRVGGGVDLIAIDVPDSAQLRLPRWETSALLAGTAFASKSDLSAKRNLALVLSRVLGWSRVLFLDDDITELDPDGVRRAGRLLATYDAVGLQVGGFPDHSVVCHAYRDAGGKQQSFIGGGAMAVAVQRTNSFFPDIYNDDWFFLLDGGKSLRPTTMTGRVRQYPYDPFRSPDRARAEEFGDVLAEGIYWLLDQGRTVTDADKGHWAGFLRKRRRFIENVLDMVKGDDALEASDKARRIDALKGSLGRLSLITPEFCALYLRAWEEDSAKWHHHIARLTRRQDRASALTVLSRGYRPLTWHASRMAGHGPVPGTAQARTQPRSRPLRPAGVFPSAESEVLSGKTPVPAGLH